MTVPYERAEQVIRVEQPAGSRGSLKWIQRAVNSPEIINQLILSKIAGVTNIRWCSPLAADKYAEYRDRGFLQCVGLERLASELEKFWPNRGPQWDALACCDPPGVLLVEAKAHIGELCSPASQASSESLKRIQCALDGTAASMGAEPKVSWSEVFYQLTNRIAHLHFLRKHGIPAWLVLVNFIGDAEMKGPSLEAEWRAAYKIVWHVLGISKPNKLSPYMVEIFPTIENSTRLRASKDSHTP
jgi:hypothetical protein